MSSTSVRVVDMTSRLGAEAIKQLGVTLSPAQTHTRIALIPGTEPRIEWVRPPHPQDDIATPHGPKALMLVVGPGFIREAEALVGQALAAGLPWVRIFVMPSAIMEELSLKALVPAHSAAAHLYRLPDSSPETLWFVLLQEFEKLAASSDFAPVFSTQQHRSKDTMTTNLKQSMESAMTIDGALAAALVDYRSGMCLAQAGGGMNLDLAAAGNSQVVRAKLQTMETLGLRKGIEDILITLGDQYHLIRLVPNNAGLFLYLVLDKAKGNLALARYKLTDIERTLKV